MKNNKFNKSKIINQLNKSVAVGLSGGVDSAAMAYFLKNRGFKVSAFFFELDKKNKESYAKAKKVARILKIKLEKINLKKEFKDKIKEYFIQSYRKNITPNPCIFCNSEIKFKFLKEIAQKNRINYIATGHYAKIKKINGHYYILKAKDKQKDQTYFLYRLPQVVLSKTIFFLGNYEKKDIINIIKKSPLKEMDFFKESQDICFFSQSDSLKKYLTKFIKTKRGKILDEKNNFLGWHSGLPFYTQGQRKGLNLSGGPFYVVKKDKSKNILIVSRNRNYPFLQSDKIIFNKTFWVAEAPKKNKKYQVKVRYLSRLVNATIEKNKANQWMAYLFEKQWAVAEGQSLVIYEGDKIIGGGIIKKIN